MQSVQPVCFLSFGNTDVDESGVRHYWGEPAGKESILGIKCKGETHHILPGDIISQAIGL